MLHTVNKSPFQNGTMESCLRCVNPGDAVLLLEDGVFGAVTGTSKTALIEEALKNAEVYALSADLKARALENIIPGIKVTDYAGFVDLVDQNKVHSWL
ncbi:MAG: sulfurtransferase complex subunit TusB [Magnetococcales bacterium]|nr:sulfurtransferase complex subunit TusB [Magnetococcales bacterium]